MHGGGGNIVNFYLYILVSHLRFRTLHYIEL